MQESDCEHVNGARMENPRPREGGSAPQSPRGAPPMTTFVRTDAATFKELVQRLTAGPLDDAHRHRHRHRPPSQSSPPRPPAEAASIPGHRLSGVGKRVHESRRGGGGRRRFTALRPRSISLPASPSALSPAASPGASPSTGLAGLRICAADDDGAAAAAAELNEEEEERAIKEKRFYLHPSPRPRPASAAEPELLPLFPLSSSNSSGR